MTRARLALDNGAVIPLVLQNAVATFPQPVAAGGGGDVSVWRGADGFGPVMVDIAIRGSAACLMDGPLGIYGEKDNGDVGFLGYLNGGEPIRIQSAVVGFNQQINAAGFKRLLVGGVVGLVTPSGGATATVKATPILTNEF